MLKVSRGSKAEAYQSLKNMDCVKEVHHLLGEFPLFVIIQSENMARLNELIESVKERSGAIATWHVLVSNSSDQCSNRTNGHAGPMRSALRNSYQVRLQKDINKY
jgi:hypothetical protein